MIPLRVSAAWALLPLRRIVGYGFFAHGMAKSTRGPAGFAKRLHLVGTPLPAPMAWLVTLLEVFRGGAIVAGLLVRVAALPLIVSMLVAMFTLRLRYGFSAVDTIGLTPAGPLFGAPCYEINLLYIAALVALALAAPSALSLDAWLARRGGEGAAPAAA